MKIIDISPIISEEIDVWPGDTPYKREVLMDVDKGDHLGLSKITTTLHLGAHTDAPNHYGKQADGMSSRSLNYYFGPCQIISTKTPKGERVLLEHLQTQEINAPRVILKTSSFLDHNNWNDDFCSLSVELINFLAQKNVLLVGIDTPSVDPISSKDLPSHHEILKHNMAILEGVILEHVEDGLYTLSALPLNLKSADASPVRAVLLPEIKFPE